MISKYFKIQELVSKSVYDKYGDKCWEFINPKIIIFLDRLRKDLDKPITVNNWLWRGEFQQRGLRANKDPIVAIKKDYYLSQHCLGNAVDFNVKGMSTKEVYYYIINNYNKYMDCISRIENIDTAPTWVHVDCANTNSDALVVFRG